MTFNNGIVPMRNNGRRIVSITTRARGFTLVELMIAMTLGMVLMAGVLGVYHESSRSYKQHDELARMQENGTYALNLLAREFAMSGYLGGVVDTSILKTVSVTTDCVAGTDWALDSNIPRDFVNNAANAVTVTTKFGVDLACIDANTVQDGADIVTIKRTADELTINKGVGSDPAGTNQWYLRNDTGGSEPNWQYESSGLATDFASGTVGTDVDYWAYFVKIFFVRQFSQVSGDDIPSLCISQLEGQKMNQGCYVDGIEDLQLEFGIDTDPASDGRAPDYFTDDPTAGEIANAVAVRIYLLVRSIGPDPTYTDIKTYKLGSKNIVAQNDNYYREVFSTTTSLNNANLF
jgi:type IV pilus assembly protein PilW